MKNCQLTVAVGIPVAWYPPADPYGRSLAQRLLSGMTSGETNFGIWMEPLRMRKPLFGKAQRGEPK